MRRYIQFITVLLAAIIFLTPLHTYAAVITVIDYNDYISNITVSSDKKFVTVDLPTSNITHRLVDPYDNEFIQQGPTVEIQADEDSFNDEHFFDYIYLLGRYTYFDADNIPSGTRIYVEFSIFQLDASGEYTFGEYPVTFYLIARDSSQKALKYNSASDLFMNGEYSSAETFCVFDKPEGTEYLDPWLMIDFPFMDFYGTCYVVVEKIQMVFEFQALVDQEQDSGISNELLSLISTGSPAMNNTANQFNDKTNSSINQANGILNDLNSATKPDLNTIKPNLNFTTNYSSDSSTLISLFSGVFNSDLVLNLMLISVSVSLASLVLYGKKG